MVAKRVEGVLNEMKWLDSGGDGEWSSPEAENTTHGERDRCLHKPVPVWRRKIIYN